MSQLENPTPNPDRNLENCRLVRDALAFLATRHPSIAPDDVVHLPDDLIDWTRLVEVDFVAEWKDSFHRMQEDSLECIRRSGKEREERFAGRETFKNLLEFAKTDERAFGDLQCAALVIATQIYYAEQDNHPELVYVLNRQANAFWNASANQAMAESDALKGKNIGSFLSEDAPKAPELRDTED